MHAVRSEKNKHNMEMFSMTQKIHQKHCVLLTLLQSHCVCVLSCVQLFCSRRSSLSRFFFFFLLYFACYLSFFQKFQPQSVCVCLKQQGIFGHPFFSLLLFAHRSPSFGSATMINIIVAAAVVHRFRCRSSSSFHSPDRPKRKSYIHKISLLLQILQLSHTHTDTELYRLEFDHKNDKNIIFFLLLPLLLLFVGSLVRSFVCSFICLLVLSFAFLDCNDVRNQN